jgi:hypothetical protein
MENILSLLIPNNDTDYSEKIAKLVEEVRIDINDYDEEVLSSKKNYQILQKKKYKIYA